LSDYDALLQADESTYRITVLKREPKDFSYRELREEVERRQFFEPLHAFAKRFLETAGISTESGRYYASLVKFYTLPIAFDSVLRMKPSLICGRISFQSVSITPLSRCSTTSRKPCSCQNRRTCGQA
jgi:hypothetical protein